MKNWENVGQFILTQAFWIIIHLKYKIKNILLCDFFFPSNIWTNKPPNVFTQFKSQKVIHFNQKCSLTFKLP